MRVPNARRARIDRSKLRGYLLSRDHPVGKRKAAFFEWLGYTQRSWRRLEADLRSQHLVLDAFVGGPTDFGRKYEIRARLSGPTGRSASVVSVWIVLSGETIPRFVTATPGEDP